MARVHDEEIKRRDREIQKISDVIGVLIGMIPSDKKQREAIQYSIHDLQIRRAEKLAGEGPARALQSLGGKNYE